MTIVEQKARVIEDIRSHFEQTVPMETRTPMVKRLFAKRLKGYPRLSLAKLRDMLLMLQHVDGKE